MNTFMGNLKTDFVVKTKTFTIIKPNAVKAGNIGDIIKIIEDKGFVISRMEMITLSLEQAIEFYAEHNGNVWFDELIQFMTSAPIVAMVLEKDNAVLDFRAIIGSTNPNEAVEGSIRKLYAKNQTENAIHASDSEESAKREIKFFFHKITQ